MEYQDTLLYGTGGALAIRFLFLSVFKWFSMRWFNRFVNLKLSKDDDSIISEIESGAAGTWRLRSGLVYYPIKNTSCESASGPMTNRVYEKQLFRHLRVVRIGMESGGYVNTIELFFVPFFGNPVLKKKMIFPPPRGSGQRTYTSPPRVPEYAN